VLSSVNCTTFTVQSITMSREIDRLPQPCSRRKTKLIIASCSR
jgi:hypothetical protein